MHKGKVCATTLRLNVGIAPHDCLIIAEICDFFVSATIIYRESSESMASITNKEILTQTWCRNLSKERGKVSGTMLFY